MRYLVVIEKGPTSFGAYVPDLPGCVAVGETREEVIASIHEAIEFHLGGLKQDGAPILRPLRPANWSKSLPNRSVNAAPRVRAVGRTRRPVTFVR